MVVTAVRTRGAACICWEGDSGTGALAGAGTFVTDAQGMLKLDPAGLGTKRYVVRAASLIDGSQKDSAAYVSAGAYVFTVGTAGLKLKVVDDVTGAAMSGLEVNAYEKLADGSKVWRAKKSLGSDGLATFDLDGLGSGRNYTLEGQPFGQWLTFAEASQTGSREVRVGKLQVQVVDGQTGQPKAGQLVSLRKWQSDGNHVSVMSATTDAQGWLKLDPPAVGTDPYVAQATSPTDGQLKTSAVYLNKGPHKFVLGNAPVVGRLVDASSQAVLAGKEVTAYEKKADGTLVSVGKRTTDANGTVSFDLDGLSEGRRYILRTKPYVHSVDSAEVTQAGEVRLRAGKLHVQLLDGRNGQPYGLRDVFLLEGASASTAKGIGKFRTDAEGRLRLDPAGLGSSVYVIRASSLVDGSQKDSPGYVAEGSYTFRVGNASLTVQVLDDVTGAGLAGLVVNAYEKKSDGSKEWKAKRTLNADGQAAFDLEGLGAGKSYVLEGQPFAQWVTFAEVSETGWKTVRVGKLQVQVMDGQTGQPRAGQLVSLRKWQSDGNHVAVTSVQTDSQGWLKLDPPTIGTDPYVLQAVSPTDGQLKTSAVYWGNGPHKFVLGNAPVVAKLVDGVSQAGLPGKEVVVYEKKSDGTLSWLMQRTTNASGAVSFDLDGLASGRKYVLRTKPFLSSLDSPEITQSGEVVIQAGKLQVKVVDGRDGSAYAGRSVYLLEGDSGTGALAGAGTFVTDAQGMLKLDPAGLGTKRYVVRAASLIDGSQKDSAAYVNAGAYTFTVGNPALNVTVLDVVTGAPLANQEVNAYETDAAGGMTWRAKNVTDATGTLSFDLEGLGGGKLFKLGGTFYENWEVSTVISSPGAFVFRVGAEHDRVPPTVSILQPGAGKAVSKNGFSLYGLASDDRMIKTVKVVIGLPSGKTLHAAATHHSTAGTWHLDAISFGEEKPGAVKVTVTAVDQGSNETRASLALDLVEDVTPPTLSVDSHVDGGKVPLRGFVLRGVVKDNTLSPTLRITVSGAGLTAVAEQAVEVDESSGRWAYAIAPEESFQPQTLQIVLKAKDTAGNEVVKTLSLMPDDVFEQAWHVLQRTSFGAMRFNEVVAQGVSAFIAEQLRPALIEDSNAEAKANTSTEDVQVASEFLRRATYSKRQLREVMTWFWDNHFNTNYNAHLVAAYETAEMSGFRSEALGSFRRLMGISARSPAMLYTLDGVSNMKNSPNENYARELLELHTLGINGGYTQKDVEEVARAFTGWGVKDGAFFFDTSKHDSTSKVVLGTTISASGVSAGDAVLDILARNPSTARFVCQKLVAFLVSDVPAGGLIDRCAEKFIEQSGASDQIAQVVGTILNSTEFLGEQYRRAKVKTPLEFVIGAVRQMDGVSSGNDLASELQIQGMPIYLNSVPTGYSDSGEDWVSSGMLLMRSRFSDRLLSYAPEEGRTSFSLSNTMAAGGGVTAEGVAALMLERLLGPTFTARHVQLAKDLLTDGGTYPFKPDWPDAEIRVRRLGKLLMVLPEYQLQ